MLKIIGLTGPSGSGKTTFSAFLAQNGVPVIDCDRVAREASAPGSSGLNALIAAFGREFICPDGSLNRRALGEFVFGDAARCDLLNKTTHPFILQAIEERLQKAAREKLVVLDAPTLFQSGLDRRCDFIIGVLAAKERRLERMMRRDGLQKEQAEQRLNAQLPDDVFRARCDLIVENNETEESLKKEAGRVLRGLQEKYR